MSGAGDAVVAVKMLRTFNIEEEDIVSLLREARIMSEFNHINVLTIVGVVWQKGDPPLIVLPYMGKGSLLSLIRQESSSVSR